LTESTPPNDAKGSSLFRDCEILDTPAEPEYDDVIQVAVAICGTPMAFFGLDDGERMWLKAKHGIPMNELAKKSSICKTVMELNQPIVIPDLSKDARPVSAAVFEQFGIRFYAGVPIQCSGEVVGTLCVADTEPKSLSAAALAAMSALARQIGALLEARIANYHLTESRRQLAAALSTAQLASEHANISARRLETLFRRVPVPCFTCDTDMTVFEWNRAAERLWKQDAFEAVMRTVPDVVRWPLDSGFIPEGLELALQGECVEGYEWRTTMADGSYRWLSSSAFPLQSSNGNVVGAVCTCVDITDIRDGEGHQAEHCSGMEAPMKLALGSKSRARSA
jgi:PAS domain S-box-containing protein